MNFRPQRIREHLTDVQAVNQLTSQCKVEYALDIEPGRWPRYVVIRIPCASAQRVVRRHDITVTTGRIALYI
jgi:hypothetical protein